jgi:hypothetical protein
MSSTLPDYFFRIRENGALVFRIDTENRQRRIDMDQIAVVNVKNGEVKPHGARTLDHEDMAAITAWMAKRKAQLAARENDRIARVCEQLNLAAHWANTRATPEELDAITDELLLAMHDLRSVLVRKKADRFSERD